MRRSGSSSCMLRPRHSSTDSLDSAAFGEPLSVTMISREELPSFSTERFFMLSEFHLNAHSLRFVADLHESDDVTPETVDTDRSSTDEVFQHETNDTGFAPFLIFYILWRPTMTRNVAAFTSDVISPAVRKIQSLVDIALSDEEKKRSRSELPGSPSSGRLSALEESEPDNPSRELDSVNGSFCSAENGKTRLYLVVERTVPFQGNDDTEETRKSQFEGETRRNRIQPI